MTFRLFVFIALIFLIGGCAQVPPSSVTLSSSVADDVMSMQSAHKEFVNYYYDSIEKQANTIIDEQYRPELIRKLIDKDVARFKDSGEKHKSLIYAIQKAFVNTENLGENGLTKTQALAMGKIKIFYTNIDKDVELERKKLLDPLRQQRQKFLTKVDANYTNIIKKNAAITALLHSVVKVHETQQQLFSIAGGEINFRREIGNKISNLADKIEKTQGKSEDASTKIEEIKNAFNDFKNSLESD